MKRKLALFFCALTCALLIAFNPDAMAAAREGFSLWRDSVMPALLPFFVCTSLMRQMGALQRGNAAALFALAFVSGAPGGARLSSQYAADGDVDAGLTCLAASLNTISPMYIAGAFATGMLGAPHSCFQRFSPCFLCEKPTHLCSLQAHRSRRSLLRACLPQVSRNPFPPCSPSAEQSSSFLSLRACFQPRVQWLCCSGRFGPSLPCLAAMGRLRRPYSRGCLK